MDATGVEKIMDQAFENCSSLTTVTNLDSVKELNSRAFQDCTLVKSIEFSSSEINIYAKTWDESGWRPAGVFEGWTADQEIIFSGLTEAPQTWASAWNANSSAKVVWKTE